MATNARGGLSDELVQVAHVEGSFVAGRLRNVIAFYWMTAGNKAGVEALMQLCEEMSQGRKQSFSAVHIVRQRMGLPDAEIRQALTAGMKKYADVTGCLAIVTLGAGFWVSALQGAVTGIRMLAPVGASTLRFVPKLDDLKGWFASEHAELTGQTIDEARLLEGLYHILSIGDRSRPPSSPT